MLRVRVCLLGQRAVRIEVGVKDGRPRASSEMTTTCEGGVSVVQPRCFICDEHHLQGLGSIKSQEMVQRPLFSLASPWARYFNLTRGWPSLSLLFLCLAVCGLVSLVQASALLFTLRFLCSMYTNIHPSLPLLNLRQVFICVFPFTHLQISEFSFNVSLTLGRLVSSTFPPPKYLV